MKYRWRWEGLGGIQCLPVIIWLEASSKEIRLRTNQTCSKAGNCWLASQFGFASDWVAAPVNPQSSNICLMSVNICLIFVNICLIFVNTCLIFVNICGPRTIWHRGQFGTVDNLAPPMLADNLAPQCKSGQFGTRTIWHRSVKWTIWHRGQFGTAD